jgi:hypothetical protein
MSHTPITKMLRAIAAMLLTCATAAGCGQDAVTTPVQPSPPAPQDNLSSLTRTGGGVFDSAYRVVGGARVEFVDGPRAGQFVTTDQQGRFIVEGPIRTSDRFRASKAGYRELIRPLSALTFILESEEPAVQMAGTYTLTVIADASCTGLPVDLRTRTYTAAIRSVPQPDFPADTQLVATLSGAVFPSGSDFVWLSVAARDVVFWFDPEDGSPSLIELPGPARYLTVFGSAQTTAGADPSTISASLNGTIEYCERESQTSSRSPCRVGPLVTQSACTSAHHQVILTRQ